MAQALPQLPGQLPSAANHSVAAHASAHVHADLMINASGSTAHDDLLVHNVPSLGVHAEKFPWVQGWQATDTGFCPGAGPAILEFRKDALIGCFRDLADALNNMPVVSTLAAPAVSAQSVGLHLFRHPCGESNPSAQADTDSMYATDCQAAAHHFEQAAHHLHMAFSALGDRIEGLMLKPPLLFGPGQSKELLCPAMSPIDFKYLPVQFVVAAEDGTGPRSCTASGQQS